MSYRDTKDSIKYPVFISGNLEKILISLEDEFNYIKNENKRLRKENEELKEKTWADKELAKLKEKYEIAYANAKRGFAINEDEQKIIDDFISKHPHHYFKYIFEPTPLGIAGTIYAYPGNDKVIFAQIG